jgi:hypothetical protein
LREIDRVQTVLIWVVGKIVNRYGLAYGGAFLDPRVPRKESTAGPKLVVRGVVELGRKPRDFSGSANALLRNLSQL